MDFNPILDELPDSFLGCRVNTDFRQGLRFFSAMSDNSLDDSERGLVITRLFFPDTIPEPVSEIWPFIEYFISGGDEKKGNGNGQRVFDFNADAGRIYAAFLQTYRINLRQENMHWWLFLELFRDIPEDTMLLKVIDIRGKKPPKYADDEYKTALRKAKRAFAIDSGNNDAASLGDVMRSWAGR